MTTGHHGDSRRDGEREKSCKILPWPFGLHVVRPRAHGGRAPGPPKEWAIVQRKRATKRARDDAPARDQAIELRRYEIGFLNKVDQIRYVAPASRHTTSGI